MGSIANNRLKNESKQAERKEEEKKKKKKKTSERYVLSWVYVVSQRLIQSTLVISNSKGLSEILRDIRSSTYQVCRIEEKII